MLARGFLHLHSRVWHPKGSHLTLFLPESRLTFQPSSIDHTAFINELVKSYATGQRPNLQSAQRALSGGLPASQQQPAVSRHDSAPTPLPSPQTSSQSQSSSPIARTRDEEPNKKRKRVYTDEEWREWRVNIPLKIEAERRRIEDEISQRADANKEIQALFNELQGLAAEFVLGFAVMLPT
jgi:hypothetical protein